VALLEKSYVPGDAQSAFQFARALNNLGSVQADTGHNGPGIATLQRSAAVTEAAFGSASINLVGALNSLAVAYCKHGDYERARQFYEKTLRILGGAPPYTTPQRVDVLNNFAQMCLDVDDEDGALRLFKQAQQLAESELGPTDFRIAYSLNGLE
jgi:pentatricopeptide repeat protein